MNSSAQKCTNHSLQQKTSTTTAQPQQKRVYTTATNDTK